MAEQERGSRFGQLMERCFQYLEPDESAGVIDCVESSSVSL